MKTPIQTNQAPAAIGPYSQAIEAGGMVFVSGQLPIDPATGEFAEGDIQALTHQSLTNLKHVLEAAGLTLANVVKTTVFLADLADFAAMNEVYATYFSAPFPRSFCRSSEDIAQECSCGNRVYRRTLSPRTPLS